MLPLVLDETEEAIMQNVNPNPDYWESIWEHQMELALEKWEDEYFWYERTQLPPIGLKTSNYADELISRMNLSSHNSVLDVGCGDGAIAIRIAKKVKQVTAFDANPNLLFPITQRANSEGIMNLKFVNAEWLETRISRDIALHDIVLASRFRQIMNLMKFLEQMHLAARECCYITWIAEREEMDANICDILGKEYHPLPDYFVIVNMLENMNISPSVEIFETLETHEFNSEQDAIENTMRGYLIEDQEARNKIAQMVASGLEYREGYVVRNTPAKWALVGWEK